ncbi:MAG: glycerol-3-phosphate acyltransferase PlsY [Candidatus Poriferisodalaceae bacterium]|jgi:glycerol-3-phosphate acyltransferase PlsY
MASPLTTRRGSDVLAARRLGAIGLGYLAGTVPSADLAARAATRGTADLRKQGSGNPGAANASKVLGAKWGFAVLAADIAKGHIAGRLGRRVAGEDLGIHLGATAAVVGHCWPIWTGFRGGKGVATSVGQVLTSFPAYFPIDVAVAVGTYVSPKLGDRAFVANSVASVVWVASSVVWWRRRLPNLWGPEPTVALPIAAATSSAIIWWKFVEGRRVRDE